jgi:hypothetical protein
MVTVTLTDMISSGNYTVAQLFIIGYTDAAAYKLALVLLADMIASLKFTVAQLFIAGYTDAAAYKAAGVSLPKILGSNKFSAAVLYNAGYTIQIFYDNYYSAFAGSQYGAPSPAMIIDLYSVNSNLTDYLNAGFKVNQLYSVNSNLTNYLAAGFPLANLLTQFSVSVLFDAGYTDLAAYKTAGVSFRRIVDSNRFSAAVLYNAGYTLQNFYDNYYSAFAGSNYGAPSPAMIIDLYSLNSNLTDYLNAGFKVNQLYSVNSNITNYLAAGFPLANLATQFSVSVLFDIGYTDVAAYKTAGVSFQRIVNSNKFSAAALYNVGYTLQIFYSNYYDPVWARFGIFAPSGTLASLYSVNSNLTDYLAAGFKLLQLVNVFPVSVLFEAGLINAANYFAANVPLPVMIASRNFTTAQLVVGGYTINAITTLAEMIASGNYTVAQLVAAGHIDAADYFAENVSLKDMIDSEKFSVAQLVIAKYTDAAAYKAAHVLLAKMIESTKFSVAVLFEAGYTDLAAYKRANVSLKKMVESAKFLIAELLAQDCYTLTDVYITYYAVTNTVVPSLVSLASLYTANRQIQNYYDAGFLDFHVMAVFTLISIYNAYYSVAARNGGVIIPAEASMTDLSSVNSNIQQYKDAGFLSSDLIPTFTLQQVLRVYSLSEVVSSGFESKTKPQMIQAFQGLSSIADMRQAGLNNVKDYKDAQVSLARMIDSFSVSQLVGSYTDVSEYKDAQVSLARMIDSFSVSALVGSYTNVSEYKDANVPLATMLAEFTVSQLVSSYTDVSEYKDALVSLARMIDSFSVSALVGSYTDVSEYKDALVPVQNLLFQGVFLIEDVFPTYSLAEIVNSNYTTKPLMIVTLLELANTRTTDTVSIQDLFSVGLQSAQDYKDANIPVRRLLDSSKFSPDTVFPAYSLINIVNSGFNLSIIIQKLKAIVSIADFKAFKALNVTLANFKAANVLVSELIPTFTLQEVSGVFSLSEIVSSGFESKTKSEIIQALQTLSSPPSVATMIGAGLSNTQDFTDAGITVSPGFSTLATTSVALQNIITTLASAPTTETKALLTSEIQNIQLENAIGLTDMEKTDIVLSQIPLSILYSTFVGQRIPDIITPAAIIASNPTIEADDFQVAGFQPIEIYGLFSIKDLLASGYTSVPLFPAQAMGNRLSSFNSQV